VQRLKPSVSNSERLTTYPYMRGGKALWQKKPCRAVSWLLLLDQSLYLDLFYDDSCRCLADCVCRLPQLGWMSCYLGFCTADGSVQVIQALRCLCQPPQLIHPATAVIGGVAVVQVSAVQWLRQQGAAVLFTGRAPAVHGTSRHVLSWHAVCMMHPMACTWASYALCATVPVQAMPGLLL
jgi:hypothetical protein